MKVKTIQRIRNKEGLTLPELMIASVIMVIAFVGILLTYLRCMELSEMSRNTSRAIIASKSRMEQIKNSDFNLLVASFNNVTFTAAGINGIGVSNIDTSNPDLFQITVSFCWQNKNGRVIGEDSDLDGVLDAGEDTNGNGIIDSPVQLVSFVFDE